MNRRSFLKNTAVASALMATPMIALAAKRPRPLVVTLIEIANFYCSRCNALNASYDRIFKAAYDAKIDCLFAPATWEDQSLWPNRVYYSIRDLYPALEPLARNIIFKGIHAEGQLFESHSQVSAYLTQNKFTEEALKVYPDYSAAAVAERADSNEPLYSEIRVSKLIELAGVSEVPTFLFLGDAKVIDLIGPGNDDLAALTPRVLAKIENFL